MTVWPYIIDPIFLFLTFLSLGIDFLLVNVNFIISFFNLLGEVSESSALVYLLAYIVIDWLAVLATTHKFSLTNLTILTATSPNLINLKSTTLNPIYVYTKLTNLSYHSRLKKSFPVLFWYERL